MICREGRRMKIKINMKNNKRMIYIVQVLSFDLIQVTSGFLFPCREFT